METGWWFGLSSISNCVGQDNSFSSGCADVLVEYVELFVAFEEVVGGVCSSFWSADRNGVVEYMVWMVLEVQVIEDFIWIF